MNQALAYTPTWLDKLRWKLFPQDTCDIPDIPAKDCVIVRTGIRFSFTGRIRVLLSGRIEVETKTATEHMVGNTATASCCNIKAPRFLESKAIRIANGEQ